MGGKAHSSPAVPRAASEVFVHMWDVQPHAIGVVWDSRLEITTAFLHFQIRAVDQVDPVLHGIAIAPGTVLEVRLEPLLQRSEPCSSVVDRRVGSGHAA
jgi:hypothetical protein